MNHIKLVWIGGMQGIFILEREDEHYYYIIDETHHPGRARKEHVLLAWFLSDEEYKEFLRLQKTPQGKRLITPM